MSEEVMGESAVAPETEVQESAPAEVAEAAAPESEVTE